MQSGRALYPILERCDLSGAEDRKDARIGPSVRFSRYTMQHLRDEELEKEVEAAQAAVSLGHALRKEYKLKVRQPLQKAHLITSNKELLAFA